MHRLFQPLHSITISVKTIMFSKQDSFHSYTGVIVIALVPAAERETDTKGGGGPAVEVGGGGGGLGPIPGRSLALVPDRDPRRGVTPGRDGERRDPPSPLYLRYG